MSVILWNTLKAHRWPTLAMAALLLGLGVLIVASYDSFGPEGNPEFYEQIPKAMAALMKAEGNLLLASGPEGFIAIGFRHPVFLIIVAAFGIGTASAAMAREIERRTVLLILARPLPRYHLVLGKGLGSLLGLVVLVAALLVGSFIGIATQGLDGIKVDLLLIMGFNALCLGLAIAGYAYLISALSSDGSRVNLLATGVTVAFFFLDFISDLFDVLDPVGLLSVFKYFDPVNVAIDGSFPVAHISVLLTIAAMTFGSALLVFQRRDISA